MGTYVHGDKTTGDDEAVLLLTFEGGAIGLAEESWNKPGGMDDRAEVFGSDGQAYADLLYGNSLRAFSRRGYGYAVEKAGSTAGWSFPIYQEIWNYGFPQEMEHFVSCVRTGDQPSENGHDGRAVVEAVLPSTSQPREAASRAAVRERRPPADRPLADPGRRRERAAEHQDRTDLLPPLPDSLRAPRALRSVPCLPGTTRLLQEACVAHIRRSGRARPEIDGRAAPLRHAAIAARLELPPRPSTRSSPVRSASSSRERSEK